MNQLMCEIQGILIKHGLKKTITVRSVGGEYIQPYISLTLTKEEYNSQFRKDLDEFLENHTSSKRFDDEGDSVTATYAVDEKYMYGMPLPATF